MSRCDFQTLLEEKSWRLDTDPCLLLLEPGCLEPELESWQGNITEHWQILVKLSDPQIEWSFFGTQFQPMWSWVMSHFFMKAPSRPDDCMSTVKHMRGSCFCLDLLPHLSCRFVSTWKGTLRMPSKRTRLTRSGSWMLGWPRSRNNSWGIVKLSPVVGGRPSKWGCLVPCTSRVWGVGEDVLRQQLREMLNELGFHDGSVSAFDRIYWKSRGDLWRDIQCAQVGLAQDVWANVLKYINIYHFYICRICTYPPKWSVKESFWFTSSGLLDPECLNSSQVMAIWSGDDAPVVDDAAMAVSEQPDGAMAMAFGQQLARNVNDYGAETQRMILSEVSFIKEEFMELCKLRSMHGLSACIHRFAVSQSLARRSDFNHDMMKDKLEEHLADLGFSSLEVSLFIDQSFSGTTQHFLGLSARWDANALTDDPPQVTSGTCASCPICYQHRPAVALVPCGHVVCRDCHRSERLRQCPMCREVTLSATRGLFIDQWYDKHW